MRGQAINACTSLAVQILGSIACSCVLYFVHMLNTFLAIEALLSYLEHVIRGAFALV